MVRKIDGFDTAAYRRRLRIMREILTGEIQEDFAKRLGINFKRWSNYERGYPIPREAAWVLWEKFQIDPAWLWWGKTGNLSVSFVARIRQVEEALREEEAAARSLAKAKQRHSRAITLRRKASRAKGVTRGSPSTDQAGA